MFDWILSGLVAGSILVVILTLIFIAAMIVAYILTSLGLYSVAKKRRFQFPWMSWVPVLRYYMLGSLLKNQLMITPQLRIPYFQFVLPLASVLMALDTGFLTGLLTVATYALIVAAYAGLFRQYQEPNAIVFGILAGLPIAELIGCFLVYQLGQRDAPDPEASATVFP